MTKTKKFVGIGILGAGYIADLMANTIYHMQQQAPYAEIVKLVAIGSRNFSSAEALQKKYQMPKAYGSYAELLNDQEVDLIYIATPHSHHLEHGLACLKAGKHILVEKSFTVNTAQAKELLAEAKRRSLLCTEAIWTRYMPSRQIINEIIISGKIGEVKSIYANLCYPVADKERMYKPELAGGALLDLGVYPLNFIDMITSALKVELQDIKTSISWHETPVDAQNNTTLYYSKGIVAEAMSSMLTPSDRLGTVFGTKGYLVCTNINNVETLHIYNADHQLVEEVPIPKQITGYEYEVYEACQCILRGELECPSMPHTDTIRIMELMDQIRDNWGLKYPIE